MIFMLLPELQSVSYREGRVTMFDLMLTPDAKEAAVESAIARAGPLIPAPTEQMLARDRNIEVMRAVSRSVSLIALVMGSLSVLNTLLMAVQERTREIGVMMAIGWSRWRTMASIVMEGILIGVGGCVIGVPLAYVVSLIFKHLPSVEGILTFQPTLGLLLPMCAVSLLICALGSLYPAWRAASMRPSDALRRF
jgi:putative ABC transport system permease protein